MLRPRPAKKEPQPSPDDPRAQANSRCAWGVCGFLLVAVGLIYGQTLGHGFLNYDDGGFVFANPHVRAGLTVDGLRWAFTDGPYGEWYPLDPLSHMLDCQLFGLDAWGHHLTNVLLHAATSIALFLVLWRMTGELWPSAFVAALFAVHPQNVESVAWVSERRDVLSGLLFVLTLGAYLGYVRHGRPPVRYLLVAVLFALALMAKPMVVTLPPLLLLLDFWPLSRIGSAIDTPGWTPSVERSGAVRLVLEKLPLAALAAGRLFADAKNPRRGRPVAPLVGADRECGHFLHHLRGPSFLPRGPGGILSLSGGWSADVGGGRGRGRAGVGKCGRVCLAAPVSILLCRLVLVFGDVVSGPRSRLDLRSRHGRSLHVSSWHWALHRAGLGGRADGRRPARRAPAAGRWRGSRDRSVGRLCRVADHILARRRGVVEPCPGVYLRQWRSRTRAGRRAGATRPDRGGDPPLPPCAEPRDRGRPLRQPRSAFGQARQTRRGHRSVQAGVGARARFGRGSIQFGRGPHAAEAV